MGKIWDWFRNSQTPRGVRDLREQIALRDARWKKARETAQARGGTEYLREVAREIDEVPETVFEKPRRERR